MNEDVYSKEQEEVVVSATTPSEVPYASFKAWRSRGLRKREEWMVDLTSSSAEFHCAETGERIHVPKDQASSRILFTQQAFFVSGKTVNVRQGKKAYTLSLDATGKSELKAWFPPKTVEDMKKDLRNWGIGLILLGVLHFLLSGFLDPVWGAVIVVVGVLNLLIRRRGMFIVNGLALIGVGIMNIVSMCSSLSAGASGGGAVSTPWVVMGLFQIGWGVQEIRKYAQYG
ncbi:MAG: hypothetical protein IMY86_02090 [Chloroflexi bacterium]|nr:hypothetical protein [Chloroflexota bacterium]